jgi:hypothetical protein
MAPEPTTDSERLHLWLDPVIRDAIDAHRGTKSRPAFALEAIAEKCGLTGYKPRGRGQPKKSPE